MKNCPRCNSTLDDNALFCTACGLKFNAAPEQPVQNTYAQPNEAPVYPAPAAGNAFNNTGYFSAQEVADNKLYAMIMYVTGLIGIIIVLLAQKNKNSAYLEFHIKECLKLMIVQTLLALVTGVLACTIIVPIIGAICLVITVVVQFIGFYKTARNQSVELPIIKNLGFLK